MAQQQRRAWAEIGYLNKGADGWSRFTQAVMSQLNARGALALLAAVLLSQATLPGGAMAFCVPLVAALLLLEMPAWPALIGCAVGILIRWQPITLANGWQLAGCALLLVIIRKGWDWKPWKVSLMAAAVMLPPLPLAVGRFDQMIICLSGALAAGLLTPVYMRALSAMTTQQPSISNDDKLCCLLMAAALALGASWVQAQMLSLSVALASLVVLAIALAGGPGLALPAGVMMGLALMVDGASFEMLALLAVLGGLTGALTTGRGRILPLLGGLTGCALVAYFQGELNGVIQQIPSLGLGAMLALALPPRALDTLRGLLEREIPLPPEADATASAYLLANYAEATASMARALPIPDAAQDTPPVELLACRLCTGCDQQQACWDARQRETMNLLSGVLQACADEAGPVEAEQAAELFGCVRAGEIFGLASSMIAGQLRKEREDARRLEARGWALQQLHGQARSLLSLAEQMGDVDQDALRARQAICLAMPALRGRPDALTVCTLDGKLHVWLDIQCGDGQADRLAQALGAALDRPMELLELNQRRDALLFVERPRFRLTIGRTGMPIEGEEISGDCTLCERLGAKNYMIALSDGMGSGRAAREESRAALDLLHQALRAGYRRGDALRTVNGLMVACRGDEMFSTMDLCVVDLDSGEASLEKLGACSSFLLRQGRCKRISGDALPMGILESVRPRTLAARLQPGDLLLMVSDGVVDAFGGDDPQFLRALGGLSSQEHTPTPQKFADVLLRRAFEKTGGAALDDMTVLVARVEEQ